MMETLRLSTCGGKSHFICGGLSSNRQSKYLYHTIVEKWVGALVPGQNTVVQSAGVKHKRYPRHCVLSQTAIK